MSISKQAQNMGVHASNLGGAIKDAAKTTFNPRNWKSGEAAATGTAELVKDNPGIIARIIMWPIKSTVSVASFVVKKPIDLGMRATNGVLGHATEFVKGNPKTAVIVGTAAAVVGGAHMLSKHNAKKLQAQSDTVQQLQAIQAQQPALPAPQQVTYMNSASQADVDARIAADRAAGMAPGSQTAALAARQAVQAPEAASSPAV